MERLEKLKLLLGIQGTDEDVLLQYLLQIMEQKILNYCNINDLPVELEDVLIEMTARSYSSPDGVASRAKIGDTDVTFSKDDDNIIDDFRAQLHRFRRLSWS